MLMIVLFLKLERIRFYEDEQGVGNDVYYLTYVQKGHLFTLFKQYHMIECRVLIRSTVSVYANNIVDVNCCDEWLLCEV